MAIEVFALPADSGPGNYYAARRLWGIADDVSGSTDWQIIDSYSLAASPSRFKGDPVANASWTSEGDVTQDNSWIIIEQKNPRAGFPAMQLKIQSLGAGTYADASGAGYAHEGEIGTNDLYLRMSPIGGWDLADVTPDFASPNKASDNRRVSAGHAGSGNDHKDFIVALADILFWFSWNIDGGFIPNIVAYIGDYAPKTAGQDTITNPARMILSGDSGVLHPPTNRIGNSFLKEQSGTNMRLGALDENGVFRDWDYCCSSMYDWLAGESQPNEFESVASMDLFEIVIRGFGASGTPVGFDDRIIGSLKHVFRGWGLGPGVQFASRTWCCGAGEYTVIFPWDGSTDVV